MSKKRSHWKVLSGGVIFFIKHPSTNIQDAFGYVSLKFKEVQSGDINLGVMLQVERMETTEKCFKKGNIQNIFTEV